MDPIWQMHMQMLTKRKKVIEISEKIDKSLFEYYSELGKPVPKWRLKKDPDWWTRYLDDLGIDPRNP